jgi:hypothetical protein
VSWLEAVSPAQERDPSRVGARPEPGQQRGQHGQRTHHRDGDHRDGPGRYASKWPAPHQEQRDQRGHHGHAGHQDGAPGRAGRDAQRFRERPAVGPLFAFAAQVEQRVVDADRHPDDHHDLVDLAEDWDHVADEHQDSERRGQRGQAEQQRDAGRHQGAEHEQQQDQRDRYRDSLGLAEIRGVVDRLLDARFSGLGDEQDRVAGLHGGDRALVGGRRLVDVGDVAGNLERDQGAAAVLRHQRMPAGRQRCGDAGGVLRLSRQRGRHLAHGLPHRRIGPERDAGSLGLDQHGLGVGIELRGRGLVQHALGLAGLPGVVLRKLRRAERLGRHENPDDQHQPAEDRGLAVPRAPARDSFGDGRSGFTAPPFAIMGWLREY